jgi:Ger(x)C family germination protein
MSRKSIKTIIFKDLINKKKNSIIVVLFIVFYIYFRSGVSFLPVEALDIPSGIGLDVIDESDDSVLFSIPMSLLTFDSEGKTGHIISPGIGATIADTRENRQLITNKKVILGVEKVSLFSESYARFGFKTMVDVLFRNPTINDTALSAITSGLTTDILSLNVPEYPSAADYLEGILEHAHEFNFFSDNYKVIDIYVRIDSEGRSLALPYADIEDGRLKITGMALFKKDKMVRKININESRIMNLLREDNVKGMLTISEGPQSYISYFARTKRKVECKKIGDKYEFTINLQLTGDIIENNLYDDIRENPDTLKEFEGEMIKKVESMSYTFIKKMQEDYKLDCLSLGREAAAKYGRGTGVDWDEIVSNSEIKVHVKVKVDKMGRGDY